MHTGARMEEGQQANLGMTITLQILFIVILSFVRKLLYSLNYDFQVEVKKPIWKEVIT